MKIERRTAGRQPKCGRRRTDEEGLATIVFITLLAIMVLLATAESKALIQLHREVRLLEQQQIKRLDAPRTNSVPVSLTRSQSAQNE